MANEDFLTPSVLPQQALQNDLRRRLKVLAYDDARAFGLLNRWELGMLVGAGIGLPMGLAWWLL